MMTKYRRAAFYLSSLEEYDRKWILQRLPGTHSSKLAELIEDLNKIGLSADFRNVNNQSSDYLDNCISEKNNDRHQAYIIDIDFALASTISEVLCYEPDGVIVAILSYKTWS